MTKTMCIHSKQEKWNCILIQNRRPHHTEPTTHNRSTTGNSIFIKRKLKSKKILYHSNNPLIVTEFSVSTDKATVSETCIKCARRCGQQTERYAVWKVIKVECTHMVMWESRIYNRH